MDTQQAGPVVVGVDGSDSARAAARWAADEATRRGARVRLIAAVDRTVFESGGQTLAGQGQARDAVVLAAREYLDAAADELSGTHPDLAVEDDVRGGSAAVELAEESEHAQLLVLGTRGRSGFSSLLAGSVAVAMAAKARCPVVAIRGDAPDGGPVVVGLDGSHDGDAALAFAVEAASARRVPLIALRAWSDVVLDAAVVAELDQGAIDAAQRSVLEATLAGFAEEFPDTEMRAVLVHDQPAPAMIDLSREAQLVVVGSRGRGGLAGLLLGSVSQALLHHAHCPVAVVRTDPGGSD